MKRRAPLRANPEKQREWERRSRETARNRPAPTPANTPRPDTSRWQAVPKQRCAWCGGRRDLRRHHVVYGQHVGREGGDCWDPRNCLVVCEDCHWLAHSRRDRPLLGLTDDNYTFARELLGGPAAYEYLRRRYGGHDGRLVALLASEAPAAPAAGEPITIPEEGPHGRNGHH